MHPFLQLSTKNSKINFRVPFRNTNRSRRFLFLNSFLSTTIFSGINIWPVSTYILHTASAPGSSMYICYYCSLYIPHQNNTQPLFYFYCCCIHQPAAGAVGLCVRAAAADLHKYNKNSRVQKNDDQAAANAHNRLIFKTD